MPQPIKRGLFGHVLLAAGPVDLETDELLSVARAATRWPVPQVRFEGKPLPTTDALSAVVSRIPQEAVRELSSRSQRTFFRRPKSRTATANPA